MREALTRREAARFARALEAAPKTAVNYYVHQLAASVRAILENGGVESIIIEATGSRNSTFGYVPFSREEIDELDRADVEDAEAEMQAAYERARDNEEYEQRQP